MGVRKIKLTLCYDGIDYHGWQSQPGEKTVQDTLTRAIHDLTGCPVHVTGASRTDAGVSALGQVAAFKIDSPIPTENFAKAINDRLPADIAVSEAVEVAHDFDVIGSARSKLYRYTIYTGPVRPVLQRNCWHLPQKLDIAIMGEAAGLLVGKKDFKSFASAADKRDSSVRTIVRCEVTGDDRWVNIETEGDGFLYNMVRNIVGTLVEVGLIRWKPQKIKQILEARDRTAAGPIAPAAGLCLMWVRYM